jgi:hypothetical protein
VLRRHPQHKLQVEGVQLRQQELTERTREKGERWRDRQGDCREITERLQVRGGRLEERER